MLTFVQEVVEGLPLFVLYGSGDFHHLSAALVGRLKPALTLVVFDNHPDWDIRPPHWACGGWVNRALELPQVRGVSVWGCGNFELNWPHRLFGNRRVDVHPWAERYPRSFFHSMTRDDWRSQFERFVDSLRSQDVYLSVDMDSLRAEEAVTNWENGLFTAHDLAWAIALLRSNANVIAGDICGAYSPPVYERRTQEFAAEWDHPKMPVPDLDRARAVNTAAVQIIWPALTTTKPAQSQR